MVTFVRKATKKSLLTMLRKAEKITPRLLGKLFEGVLFKDEYETFSAAGGLDHGSLGGLADDDHPQYPLETDVDYALVSGNDAATDITAAELEELSDESTTTLHSHALGGSAGPVCLDSYIDIKSRQTEWSLHGGITVIDTAHDLSGGNLVTTVGIGRVLIAVIAGSDVAGSITVTGTSVDRETGAETASDVDTLTIDAVTTDGSDTDADGNTRHSFTGAYLTSKWYKGSITIASSDTTITDMDTYQVSFEQWNDTDDVVIDTLDVNAYANNAAASMYGYLYSLAVTGDKCTITREVSIELPTADVSSGKYYRLRRGNIDVEIDGSTDGFWVDFFPDPLNQNYWEDVNIKVWATVGASETTVTGYTISGTVTDSDGAPIGSVTISLTGDASDSTSTASDGTYSFSNVPNGSYTVTPTKTDLYFSPAFTAVTVSNGHQISKDFSGYLVLPYSYVISTEVSESSGAVAGQLSDWTIATGKTDATIITSNLADGNSWTPSGGTKGFEFTYGDRIIYDLPAPLLASTAGIRLACLAYATQSNRAMISNTQDVTAAQLNAGSPTADGILANAFDLNASSDTNTTTAKYDAGTNYNEHNATSAGVDVDSNRYHWFRWEWNWSTEKVTVSVVRDEDDSTIYTSEQTMNAAGVTLGHSPSGLRSLDIGPIHDPSTIRIVKFWIGETTDSWPTS